MSTYTGKIAGKEVTFLKMTKAECSAVIHAVHAAQKVESSWIELTGIIGGEEHKSHLSVMFGSTGEGTLKDPAKYTADIAALLSEIPSTITKETAARFIAWADEIYREHLPIVDKRETPEDHSARMAEQNAEYDRQEEERKQAKNTFAAKYADSPDAIPTPEGMQAVVIELNYNNSDMMTDYFDGHRGHGEEMVLGYLPKNARQTEKAARGMVAKYPELSALTWNWNKEDYSMGHGYWLESSVVGKAEGVTTYGGCDNPPVWWEIKLDGGYHKALLPFRGFKQASNPAPTTPKDPEPKAETSGYALPSWWKTDSQRAQETPSATPAPTGYTVTYDRDWTWVKFPSKPAESILAALRAAGAHWGNRRGAWYFTRHAEEAEISALIGKQEAPAVEASTPAPEPEQPKAEEVLIPALSEICLSTETPAWEASK